MGGHRGVKAPLAEIHVPARGKGSGTHLFGGAHRAGAGVEPDAGKVRAQALTQAALDLLRRAGVVQSGGELVRLPLGRRVLMVQEVLTHPGLHQLPQLGAHPPVCLAVSAAIICLLPRLSRRGGRFSVIPDRSAPRGVDLRHLYSSCPPLDGLSPLQPFFPLTGRFQRAAAPKQIFMELLYHIRGLFAAVVYPFWNLFRTAAGWMTELPCLLPRRTAPFISSF